MKIKGADECFVTGSTKGIIPVTIIDDNIIGDGKPGMITQHLNAKFEGFINRY